MKTTLPYQQTSSQTYIQSHALSLSCHLPCEMLNAMAVRNLCSQGAMAMKMKAFYESKQEN